MNILNLIGNFYNNLSSDGVFFFWIIIFLFVFLLFLLGILIFKNRKLIKVLRENGVDPKEILNVSENKPELDLQIDTADEEIIQNNTDKNEVKPSIIEEENRNNKLKEEDSYLEKGPYKKNILREISSRSQTSPIHIDKVEEDPSYSSNIKNDSLSLLENMEDSFEINSDMKFADDIVKKMEEDISPSNAELTEYEKKQEEEAIISYDELLKVKDKIYNITEDEETDEFIDELKSFRLDL